MQDSYHIHVVIVLHIGFAAAFLLWQGNERFSRLFAGSWLIEAARAAILLPQVHGFGNIDTVWWSIGEVLNPFATWMLLASGAELAGRRVTRKWMLLYLGLSVPAVLLGRFAGPTLIAKWFELPITEASFCAVLVNLVIMFVPVTIARSFYAVWLFGIWKDSRDEGALIAFLFCIPYVVFAIAVPFQYYFSWYPAWAQSTWWIRIFGFSMGIFMLIVTRAEAARRKGDALFRTLFEQAAVGVAYVDSQLGVVQQANQRFSELTGVLIGDLPGMSLDQILNPEELEKCDSLRRGIVQTVTFEKSFGHSDSTVVWGNLTLSPMSFKGKQSAAWIVIIEDVTRR